MTENLKPCPFCGGVAEADHRQSYRAMSDGRLDHGAAIYCTSCNANMIICRGDHPELSDDERMVIMVENWNRRAALVDVPAVESEPVAWQTMDSAPKDGTEIIAAERRERNGKVRVRVYKYEGHPNYWHCREDGVCIRPEYQSRYVWAPVPAALSPRP